MKLPLLSAVFLLPALCAAQTTEFGNLNVIQNDAGNATTSVTLIKAAGSSPNFDIRSGSTKADFNITFGTANDYDAGVAVASIAENGRNNNAFGETVGTFYTTVGVELNSTSSPSRYYLALFRAPNAEEQNVNVSCAFLPYSQWLGGTARNAANSNGGVTDTLTASLGINLGTQFTTAGSGVFGLDLTSIDADLSSQNGIVLVSHLKNEDNYASAKANPDGSFSLYVRDNGSTGTATEQDPIAFVYLKASDVGSKFLKAVGRVNNDASTDVSGGTFSVTKGGTGQWILSITGQSPATGTLIVSPEGGATNNTDNIVSYQWDAGNLRYVIESRDIVSTTAAPVLEDGATAGEDMFSFAFFEAPIVPTVAITAPTTGSTLVKPVAFSVDATADDANGTITQVEFFRNGTLIATDTEAPFSLAQTGLDAGSYSYTARATDNDDYSTTSSAVSVTVTLDPLNLPANTSLYFDGANDYVTMGAAPELNAGGPPSNGLTLECWFRKEGAGLTSSSGNGGVVCVPLFGKGRGEAENSNLDCDYFFGITTAGILVADFETYPAAGLTAGQNYPITATNTPIVDNQWYHTAVTYDGTTATWTMYLDGVEVGTATAAAGALPRYDSIQHFAIGAALNSTGVREGAFAGRMDEVRVWNYARSAAEIAATKDLEIAAATGLIGRFGFNEGTGTSTANSPGTDGAPLGTLTNGPVWVEGASFVSNEAPVATLTAPTSAYTGMAPATVALAADASDNDGTVIKVEFFQGSNKLGEDTTAPYTLDWTGVAAGTYSLTAKATDNAGASTTSTAVSITVAPNSNQPPLIAATSPAADATGIGSSTTLNVSLSDPENDALVVTFYGRKTPPVTPGADFTIATLPDTQFYSENLNNNGRAATFHAQTQWLVDNRDALNLAFVSHMGDIVQNGDAAPAEWTVADESMKRIENQLTTLRAYGIPWGAAPGNHDQTSIGNAGGANVFYNSLFGTSRYAGRSYWGGSESPTNNNNNYQLFSASGLDFVIIHLEYDARAKSNYQTILDWADAVMKAFPNRRAIVTSHWVVNTGNPASFSTQGQNIYNDLKDNPNFFLMLCGHVAGEGQRSDSFEGRTVSSILQDYQSRANGGDGWLRYFTFSPTNNTINAKTYRVANPLNPAAGTFETDADSQFTLPYDMQSALTDWIPLGTANVTSGGTSASINWTGLDAGGDYEWYASVTDTINTVGTSTRRFSTSANATPTVAITTPANNASFNTPATVNIAATANDSDGTITKVEFYEGTNKLGEDVTAPYEYAWSGVTSGSYTLSAIAVDNTGAATLSAQVDITVVNPSNMLPSVAITGPSNSATIEAGSIALAASASDPDGNIDKVEFFEGVTKLGEDTTFPYTFNWAGVTAGNYSLTAVATDNDGATTTSSVVAITVVPAGSFISSYTQNFDAMGTSGTAPPSGWTVWNGPGTSNTLWTAATGIIGGPSGTADSVGQMTLSSAALTVSNAPTANANNGYNAGAPGNSANRMLGSAPTSVGGMAFQLELTNSSGASISNLSIAYDTQRFTAVGTVNDLPGYWLFYSVDNGATWTNVSELNPVISGGTVNVPNTTGVTNVLPTTVNLANPWAAGGTLRLRWVDDNAQATSPDQIHGLDNLSITLPQPAPTVALTAPADAASVALPGPINLTATAADANGTVSKVEFFAGVTKIGEDVDSPYEFAWSGMISGSYVLTAKAADNEGATTTSAPVNITVTNPGNVPPSVAISSPADNAFVPASSLTISANASDTDGVVTKVEFFRGATKLGEDSSAPFEFTWFGVPVGTHTLTAIATDNDGGSSTSVAISVTATAFTDITTITRGSVWKYFDQGSDQGTAWKETVFDDSTWASGPAEIGYADAPVTTLREGPDGATSVTKFITYYFRKTFDVTDASHVLALQTNLLRDDGAVIYLNGVEVARSNMPSGPVDYLTQSATTVSSGDETTYFPITLPASSLVTGTNVIAVSIHQRDNSSSDLSFDLDLVSTVAGGNALPLVQITSPANNDTFLPGVSIPITATAEDSDGTITKVEFFNGATKLGEDLTAPYEFNITNATAGTYNLTARATDDFGSTATSAIVTATVTLGPSGTLVRGPYLNQSNHNGIVVRWRSSQSVIGRVRYGTTSGNLDQFTDEASAAVNHEIKLTGLTPYTRYYYSIGSATDALTPEAADTTTVRTAAYTIPAPTADDYTFRTSPIPGTATDTRVWIVGDCGRGSASQAGGRDAYYNWMGSRIPDVNIQLGDNAYNSGTDSEYQSGYFLMYPTIFRKMPQWSTLGNHDANNGNTSATANWPYFDMFTFPTAGECGGVPSGTEHYYSFDYGNIHFVCLDSQTTLANSSPTAPQSVWLQNDLASTTKTWIIAFFHHPPYSKGSHNSDSEGQMVTMRQVYNPILEAGGVDLVLTGHSHNYERSVLLDGHYDTSGTITPAMKKNAGNGSVVGFTTSSSGKIRNAGNSFTATATVDGTVIPPDGAYIKPLTGPRDHFGAIYNTAGMSGQADGGSIDHTAMYISYSLVGTVNLDISGNTLTATFIQSGGAAPDNYTIIKEGAADTDGDGVADEFEIANGMNRYSAADATVDADNDGLDARSEYLFGLNPGTSDHYPWTTSPIDATTGHIDVTFPTLPDRKYRVFWSVDLIIWHPASAEVIGDGSTRVWTDDGTVTGSTPGTTPDKMRFYKVEVRSAP